MAYNTTGALLQAALRVQRRRPSLADIPPAARARWPLLTTWGWLVPCPSREAAFSVDVGGHSAAATSAEEALDLAYRGVIPREFGRALLRAAGAHGPDPDSLVQPEAFADIRASYNLAQEQELSAAVPSQLQPVIGFVSTLLIGFRAIRYRYAQRASFIVSLVPVAPTEAVTLDERPGVLAPPRRCIVSVTGAPAPRAWMSLLSYDG